MARTGFALALGMLLAAPSPAAAIVGGSPLSPAPATMAALLVDGRFQCGGTLVRQRSILTAAHCVEGLDPGRLRVVLGQEDPSGAAEAARLSVSGAKVGPGGADVAVLDLAAPAPVAPARLAIAGDEARWAPGTRARVIGYGATSILGGGSGGLRQVRVPIRSDAECAGALTDYDPAADLCAGEPTGGSDSCSGDSGGPLLVPDGRGGELVAGVVSRGTLCALPLQYGIYARVGGPLVRDWLATVLPTDPAPADPSRPGVAALRLGRATVTSRRVRVRLSSAGTLNDLRVSLRRGGRTYAHARRSSIAGGRTVALSRRRRIAPGRYELVARARRPTGEVVRVARRVRVRA